MLISPIVRLLASLIHLESRDELLKSVPLLVDDDFYLIAEQLHIR